MDSAPNTRKGFGLPLKRIWRRPDILVSVLYSFTFVLALTPYYNGLYRVSVNLLHAALFWISLLIITLTFIRLCIRRARFERVLLTLALGLLVLLAGRQVHRWRYSITNAYIRSHCRDGNVAQDPILGGIREIKVDGIERTGAFENSSHCLFVSCSEEFYYCDHATVVIEQ
jgi:hypothetical protein